MTTADQAARLVNRFTWDAVDRGLIRRLLDEAYDAAGDATSRKALAYQPDDRMPALADRAF